MAHRHVSTMVRRWFLLLQLIWAPSGAVGTAPISTECPDKFKDREISTIRCYIDPAASSLCVVFPTEVSLTFSNTAGKVTTLCSTSYGTCTNSTNCGCLSSSGSIHTYWFSFMADIDSYSGGNLTCDLGCAYSFVKNNTKGCQTVTFAQEGSGGCGTGCIVGAVIGSCAGAILVGCIVRWAIIFKERKQRSQL